MTLRFFFLLVWIVLIIVLSLMPHWHHNEAFTAVSLDPSGYFRHIMGYFTLGLLGVAAFPRKIWSWLFIFFIMSVLLELAQMVVPERTFNINDILCNGIGLLLARLVAYFRMDRL